MTDPLDDRRYWDVKIGWRDESDDYCESSMHVSYRYAQTALTAIESCVDSRRCKNRDKWVSVSAVLCVVPEYDHAGRHG